MHTGLNCALSSTMNDRGAWKLLARTYPSEGDGIPTSGSSNRLKSKSGGLSESRMGIEVRVVYRCLMPIGTKREWEYNGASDLRASAQNRFTMSYESPRYISRILNS